MVLQFSVNSMPALRTAKGQSLTETERPNSPLFVTSQDYVFISINFLDNHLSFRIM
jgi:hypothetical protein